MRALSSLVLSGALACSTGANHADGSAAPASSVTASAASSVASTPAPTTSATAPTEEGRAAVEALRKALSAHYSYRDRLGVDWNVALDERSMELANAPNGAAFAKIAADVLARAKDPHVSIEIAGQKQRIVPHPHQPALNVALPTLQRVITDWNVRTKCLVTGRFQGYAYVLITHWERARCGAELGADVGKALADAADAKGLLLDMRGNMGGDELLAQTVAGRFVKKPTPYARHAFVEPATPGTFKPVQERVLEPIADGWTKPVVTLMGPANMSSNEAFLLMMRAAGSKLVGMRSGGSSGNPQPHDLGNGVTVYLPSWKAMFLDGTALEGIGIAPDLEVPTTAADFQKEDPVLRAAVAELARQGAR